MLPTSSTPIEAQIRLTLPVETKQPVPVQLAVPVAQDASAKADAVSNEPSVALPTDPVIENPTTLPTQEELQDVVTTLENIYANTYVSIPKADLMSAAIIDILNAYEEWRKVNNEIGVVQNQLGYKAAQNQSQKLYDEGALAQKSALASGLSGVGFASIGAATQINGARTQFKGESMQRKLASHNESAQRLQKIHDEMPALHAREIANAPPGGPAPDHGDALQHAKGRMMLHMTDFRNQFPDHATQINALRNNHGNAPQTYHERLSDAYTADLNSAQDHADKLAQRGRNSFTGGQVVSQTLTSMVHDSVEGSFRQRQLETQGDATMQGVIKDILNSMWQNRGRDEDADVNMQQQLLAMLSKLNDLTTNTAAHISQKI